MALNNTQLLNLIAANVTTGGRNTTAEEVRDLLEEMVESTLNIIDGGMTMQSEAGYSSLITLTNNKAFTHKKYVDDLVASAITNPYTAGTGLQLVLNQFSIDSTVVTLTGAQALTNKTGNISQWTNDSGYLTAESDPVFTAWLAGNPLSGYVPYTGATTNVDLGAFGLSGDGNFNFGNAVTTNQRLVRIGQDTAYADFGSMVGTTSSFALYMNQAIPSGTNYFLRADSSGNYYINGGMLGGNLTMRLNDNTIMSANTTAVSWTPLAVTAGSPIPFQIFLPNNTGQTASTNSPSFKITGNTKQFATGSLAIQYFNYFSANTVAFASASTADEVYGMYIEGSTAGTNATITNNFALGLLSGTSTIKMGNLTGSTTLPAIYLNQATPSSSNYALAAISASAIRLNAPAGGSLNFSIGTANYMVGDATGWTYSTPVTAAATYSHFTWSPSNRTNQTASTEVNSYLFNSFTTTWAAGNITTQRFLWFKTPTVAFASASTATNVYGLYVEAATAGTNATITNRYALGVDAAIHVNSASDARIYFAATNSYIEGVTNMRIKGAEIFFDAGGASATIRTTNTLWQWAAGLNMSFATSTGSQIATATNQMFAFWGKSPITQPTTAITGAAHVSPGTGATILKDDTFGGYTLQQLAAIIINTGLAA